MSTWEFENLNTGDIIKHASGLETYVVHVNYGSRVTAARTVDLTNPPEWHLVSKATHNTTITRENTPP